MIFSGDWEISGNGGGRVLRLLSPRETHSLIKTLACPGVSNKNWPLIYLSTHGALRLPKGVTETR